MLRAGRGRCELDALRAARALRLGTVLELGTRRLVRVGEMGPINLCVLGSVWLTIGARPRGSSLSLFENGLRTRAGSLKS